MAFACKSCMHAQADQISARAPLLPKQNHAHPRPQIARASGAARPAGAAGRACFEGDARLACHQVFQDLQKNMGVRLDCAEERWQLVCDLMEEKIGTLAAKLGEEIPRLVRNRAPTSRRLHTVRNDLFTVCGWRWKGHPDAVPRSQKEQGDEECGKCAAFLLGRRLSNRLRPVGGGECPEGR